MERKKMTLEDFADVINSAGEWRQEFSDIITANGWEEMYAKRWKICNDGKEMLYRGEDGKVKLRDMTDDEKRERNYGILQKEMRKLVKEGKTELLTLEDIPNLAGKKIRTIYFGYEHQDGVDEFVVGGVASEWELAEKETMKDGRTRAEYWASYMSGDRIEELKNTLMLLRQDGSKTYIRCDRQEGEFYCSDIDRYVQFIRCE